MLHVFIQLTGYMKLKYVNSNCEILLCSCNNDFLNKKKIVDLLQPFALIIIIITYGIFTVVP